MKIKILGGAGVPACEILMFNETRATSSPCHPAKANTCAEAYTTDWGGQTPTHSSLFENVEFARHPDSCVGMTKQSLPYMLSMRLLHFVRKFARSFINFSHFDHQRGKRFLSVNKLFRFALLIVTLTLPNCLLAQSRVGTTAAPFLTIGIGSRPQGMGGAFVSMFGDVNSLFWNPAGIARLERNELILIHSTWLADMNFDFIGAVATLGNKGSVGFSVTMLNVGEMEVTTVKSQDGTGLFFSSYDLATSFHYSYAFYDKFALGGTVKYIHQKIWNETASGYAFDLGTLFITPFKDIRLGMSISNFGTKMQMNGRDMLIFHDPDETKRGNNDRITGEISTDYWTLPLTLRLGLSGEIIEMKPYRLTISADWVVPNDNSEHINMGVEYAYYERYFLRFGARSLRPGHSEGSFKLFENDNGGGITAGGGFRVQLSNGVIIETNYAFEAYDRLGNIHKYSLGFKF